MRHAIAIVSSYMLDPDTDVSETDFALSVLIIENLYLP